ncbi:MAG: cellulase family glycosylhydrolase [Candidatus Dormibacteria bacterium]
MRRRAPLIAGLAATLIGGTAGAVGAGRAAAATAIAAPAVHVAGSQLVDGSGHPLRLLGVDRSGSEYACIQGWGVFDGPVDSGALAAIAAWHVNAVRVPLNEDCWLGINGVPAAYGGAAYQSAVAALVSGLNGAGMVAILDLHWTAPGTVPATGQQPMPDADHAVTFWSQVAAAYRNQPGVVFDLFNEPFPGNNGDTAAAWTCLRDGGSACTGQLDDGSGQPLAYTAAGMQQLLDAVRGSGAGNVVMVPGLQYSNTLDGWLAYEPHDPAGQLAASWHAYSFNGCATATCWDAQVAPVAATVPLVVGELGENDCAGGFIGGLLDWLDSKGASYLAWTWDTWNCSSGPALISAYDGTPTAFGAAYRDHLAALAASSAPAPSPPPFTPSGVGSPAAAVTPDGSQQLVFWRGAGGDLAEAWFGGGHWNGPVDWVALAGLGSAPAVAVTRDGSTQLVFWEGAGGHLIEAWYQNGWHGPVDWTLAAFSGRGLMGSAPAVATLANGQQVVFWRGLDGHLVEAWYQNGWHGPVSYPGAVVASAPSVAVTPGDASQLVMWQGPDGHLQESWYSNGWNGPVEWSQLGTVGGAPAVAVTPQGTQLVFFADPAGHLVEDWYSGGWNGPVDWTVARFGGEDPLSSAPTVAVTPDGTQQLVWWQGGGATLQEAWYGGGWNGPVTW